MRIEATPYSYRDNSTVPDFPDDGPCTVMDAHCAICARGAAWIARNDKKVEFRIIPLQSPLGNALMLHHGLDPTDPSSWLYLEDGQAYTSLDAVMRVGQRLGGIWNFLRVMRVMPTALQDWLYSFIARNRYRIAGRTDLCTMPDSAVQQRLLT